MNFDEVQNYLEGLLPARPDQLVRMEEQARRDDFPIIGALSANLCYVIARIAGARSIFELGSGFGYSTAWFARALLDNDALGEGGKVHHVVWDEALSQEARGHLDALGLSNLVEFHIGEAVETLSQQTELYDLILLDIDKQAYPAAIPVIEERLKPGGVLIVDNLLWHGEVLDETNQRESTKGVRQISQYLFNSQLWSSSIVPLRDGVLIAHYRGQRTLQDELAQAT